MLKVNDRVTLPASQKSYDTSKQASHSSRLDLCPSLYRTISSYSLDSITSWTCRSATFQANQHRRGAIIIVRGNDQRQASISLHDRSLALNILHRDQAPGILRLPYNHHGVAPVRLHQCSPKFELLLQEGTVNRMIRSRLTVNPENIPSVYAPTSIQGL